MVDAHRPLPPASVAPGRLPASGSAPPDWMAEFSLRKPPPGFIDDPYPWYAELRRHAPVQALGGDACLLTRYEDIVAVYRHPDARSDKRREFGPKFGVGTPLYEHHTTSLVFNDPPLHTRVRRLLMGALNQRAIARMEMGVNTLVDSLLDALQERASEPVDLITEFAAGIPIEVIGNLLDVPSSERAPLRGWSLAILSALEPAPSEATLAAGHAAVTEFCEMLRGLVDHRRRHPGDPQADVLTRLLQAGNDNGADAPFTEAELLHNCIFLLNAGHETTTNLIGNGVHALLGQRHALEQLQANPGLLGSAVEELLRFESPLQLNNRLSAGPIELSHTVLPAGTFITLAVGAANRDPAVFADPDRLDLARKPNLHLAFGHSAHACAGMNVARLEARVAIGRLVQRFPALDFAGKPERDPRVRFRGFARLPVQLI